MQPEQIIEYLSSQVTDPIDTVRPMLEATAAIVCTAAIMAPDVDIAETLVTSAGPVLHSLITKMLAAEAAKVKPKRQTKRPVDKALH